jgi:hypothetical protein
LVNIAETVGSTGSVLFTPDVENRWLVEVSEVATGVVTVLPELGDAEALVRGSRIEEFGVPLGEIVGAASLLRSKLCTAV